MIIQNNITVGKAYQNGVINKAYQDNKLVYQRVHKPQPTGTTYSVTLSGNEFIHADNVSIQWGSQPIQYTQKITAFGTYTYTTTANTLPIDITVAGVDPSYTYEFNPHPPITLTKASPSATVEVTVEEVETKWIATYSDSHTESAECDSSSTIMENEITRDGLVSVEIADCVNTIGYKAFHNYGGLTSIDIPNSVTSVGINAFYGCSGLTSIDIPSGVTNIGNQTFAYCTNLTSIVIPNSVTNIGNTAFSHCTSLTNIDIPSGVTNIGYAAFFFCSNLTSLTVNPVVPPTLGSSVFSNTNNCLVYVPAESVEAYKEAEGWSDYAKRIYPIP